MNVPKTIPMMPVTKLPLGRWMARAAFDLVVLVALEPLAVRLADALPALLVAPAAAPDEVVELAMELPIVEDDAQDDVGGAA